MNNLSNNVGETTKVAEYSFFDESAGQIFTADTCSRMFFHKPLFGLSLAERTIFIEAIDRIRSRVRVFVDEDENETELDVPKIIHADGEDIVSIGSITSVGTLLGMLIDEERSMKYEGKKVKSVCEATEILAQEALGKYMM